MTTAAQQNRLEYLDAVRAFALLLGIVFHASLSFVPVYIGWAVMDVSTSGTVSIFSLVSHSFRMPLFFLVAGFFSHMTFHRWGTARFLKSRFVRIVLPFALGWFLLRPLLVAGWVAGAESLRGDVDISNALLSGFASLAHLPFGLFVGTHLWFLYYLVLTTFTVLLLRYLIGSVAPLKEALARVADRGSAWLSSSRFALAAVALPTAACLWFMSHWGLETPDKSLVPHVPVLLIYATFFFTGWLFHRSRKLIEQFSRLTWDKVGLLLIAVTASILLAGFERQTGHLHYGVIKGAFAVSYAAMMWTLVSITIGLFRRFFDRASSVVRYVSDASYWLYLVHLPLVVGLQVAVAELPFHWSAKLLAVSLLTIAIALVMYDLFVRPTFIGATLNGRRKPRVLFRFGRHGKAMATGGAPSQG
ncbi:MAG: acyltransferase family protein [Pseudomonadota bacterium]